MVEGTDREEAEVEGALRKEEEELGAVLRFVGSGGGGIRSASFRTRGMEGVCLAELALCALFRAGKAGGTLLSSLSVSSPSSLSSSIVMSTAGFADDEEASIVGGAPEIQERR